MMELTKGTVLLEIVGDACASCYELAPVLKKVADARGIRLERIDAQTLGAAFLEQYAVWRAPTVILFKDGEEISRFTGFQPEEILELWLDAKLSNQDSLTRIEPQ